MREQPVRTMACDYQKGGDGWYGHALVFFEGGPEPVGGRLPVRRGPDGVWRATLSPRSFTANQSWRGAERERQREELHEAVVAAVREAGLFVGPDGLVGEGRTRDAAVGQGARAAMVASFAARRIADPDAWVAERRAFFKEQAERNRESLEAHLRGERARQARDEEAALAARIAEELLRVDSEGLLDGSNALAGLKRLADELKELRGGGGRTPAEAA